MTRMRREETPALHEFAVQHQNPQFIIFTHKIPCSNIRKIWYLQGFQKLLIEIIQWPLYIWLKNNTSQFLLILGGVNLCWHFPDVSKDCSDIHRFSNRKLLLICALLEICEHQCRSALPCTVKFTSCCEAKCGTPFTFFAEGYSFAKLFPIHFFYVLKNLLFSIYSNSNLSWFKWLSTNILLFIVVVRFGSIPILCNLELFPCFVLTGIHY